MKFILGGRMGDLFHMLYVVKNIPGKHDLFITDRRDLHSDGFIYSLNDTIKELEPVLYNQNYVRSIQPYIGGYTENINTKYEPVNLNMWRRWVYSANWTNLLRVIFRVPINPEPWVFAKPTIKYDKIIHCSIPEPRRGNWDGLNLFGGVFMGTIEEYNNFRSPNLPHIIPHSLEQMISLIASCGIFIGNQSLPLAIAHALDVPRIGVLNEIDKIAYIGEEKIFKNFTYVL